MTSLLQLRWAKFDPCWAGWQLCKWFGPCDTHAIDLNIFQNFCDYCEQPGKWKEIPLSLHLSFLFSLLQVHFIFSLVFPAYPAVGSVNLLQSVRWELDLVERKGKGVSHPQAVHTWQTLLPGWCISQFLPAMSSVCVWDSKILILSLLC